VVMVQEFAAGGDLYTMLRRNGGSLTERQAVQMVLQPCLLALHYLHQQGITHRDIKVGGWAGSLAAERCSAGGGGGGGPTRLGAAAPAAWLLAHAKPPCSPRMHCSPALTPLPLRLRPCSPRMCYSPAATS